MRNLKLGDNLSGKTLYFTFSETFQDFFNNNYMPISINLLTTNTGYSFVVELFQNGGSLEYQVYCVYEGSLDKDIERIYQNSDTEGLITNKSFVNLPSDFGTVISIDNTTNFIGNIKMDPKIVIVVDTQPKSSPSENKKEYILNTEELNSYEDTSDLLEINYNQVKLTRKIGIDESGNKYILEEPVIEEFELEIILFKGTNYVYVEETDFSKLTLEYYNDNPANEEFARIKEVTALIEVTDEITSQVKKKVDDNEVISVINQSAEQITIKGDRFVVDSTNFKLTADGTATAKNINIEGGTIKGVDIDLQGTQDAQKIKISYKDDPLNYFLALYSYGLRSKYGNSILSLLPNGNYHSLELAYNDLVTLVTPEYIVTPSLSQTSLIEKKKNVELFNNALSLIINSDIYQYNLKTEKDTTKKHIGLIIGKGYRCANEVINHQENGIEQYSMTSVAWQAIKELDAKYKNEVETLKRELEVLKNATKNKSLF